MGRPRTFDTEDAIRAATRTFRTHGYADSSPQLLAEAIGIGKGSLYHAFGSKHDLFMTCLSQYADENYDDFIRDLAGTEPARDRVRRVFEATVAADRSDPDHSGCLIVNTATERGMSDTAASNVVWNSIARTRTALRDVLEEGVERGEIPGDRDLDALADMLQCTMIGLRVLGRVSENDDHVRTVIEAAVTHI
ncbi:TetR/AcrR family transcriptional regulator [Knoellia sp. CPCC 206453]|uniref:TetR/AcrR family transcriptional regulator n=1 Tax=Knoellia pratensis TaxID=3404796 RepID=UPI00360AEBAD